MGEYRGEGCGCNKWACGEGSCVDGRPAVSWTAAATVAAVHGSVNSGMAAVG